jgi:hypothetical protein
VSNASQNLNTSGCFTLMPFFPRGGLSNTYSCKGVNSRPSTCVIDVTMSSAMPEFRLASPQFAHRICNEVKIVQVDFALTWSLPCEDA